MGFFDIAAKFSDSVRYVMKTDDDAFVRVDLLLERLKEHDESKLKGKRLYMGNPMWHQPVVRNKNSKRYYVSKEEYASEFFSPYCSGGGHILSIDLVTHAAKRMKTKGPWPFKFEDVNTGMLLQDLIESKDLEITSERRFLGWGTHGGKEILRSDFIMYHYVHKPWDMFALLEFVSARDKSRHEDGSFDSFDPFGFDMLNHIDFKGHDLHDVRSSEDARFQCLLDTKCVAITCFKGRCYLKSALGSKKNVKDAVSYVKTSDATPIEDGYLMIRDADIYMSNIKKMDSSKEAKKECKSLSQCRAIVTLDSKTWLKSSVDISDIRYLPGPTLWVKLYV
jgi:hypothetical protein